VAVSMTVRWSGLDVAVVMTSRLGAGEDSTGPV